MKILRLNLLVLTGVAALWLVVQAAKVRRMLMKIEMSRKV